MKVYTLNIESRSNPNDYTIRLENPIYDVTEIKLVSARIPTPQLTICETNNTFSIGGTQIVLPHSVYISGDDLASNLELEIAQTDVEFNPRTKRLTFTADDQQPFTLEFKTGTNGFDDTGSGLTTPHQVLGFGSEDVTSDENGVLVSGAINLEGPNSLVMKVSAGSDEFNQTVFTGTPFYTGHLLMDGSDTLNFNGADDHVIHHFHSGPQKHIRDLRIEFFYMSHGRLIPYDFMNQDHILKFEVTCSTDKLTNLPRVPIMVCPPPGPSPGLGLGGTMSTHIETLYEWRGFLYIGSIILVGIIVLFSMKKRNRIPINE